MFNKENPDKKNQLRKSDRGASQREWAQDIETVETSEVLIQEVTTNSTYSTWLLNKQRASLQDLQVWHIFTRYNANKGLSDK